RRGFFLNAAGIGENQIGSAHQIHERQIVQWLNQIHVTEAAQQTIDWLTNIRVQVHRVNNIHIRKRLGSAIQSLTDSLEAAPKTLATVASDQNHPPLWLQKWELGRQRAGQPSIPVKPLYN